VVADPALRDGERGDLPDRYDEVDEFLAYLPNTN
jgi:hypothetical protein